MDTMTIATVIGTAISFVVALGGLVTLGITIGKYSMRFDAIEKDAGKLAGICDELKERLIRVEDMLMLKHKGASDFFAAKRSPKTLNERGLKVFQDMDGASFLSRNKQRLFALIDETAPKTAYDVEVSASNACIALINDDIFNPIKVFVYKYPAISADGKEVEVTLEDALYILSIPLRDMYLKEHPDIEQ